MITSPRLPIVVSQPGGGAPGRPLLPVGLATEPDARGRLVLVVKTTFDLPHAGGPAVLATDQERLALDRPMTLAGASAGEMASASDFRAPAGGPRVHVVGHAFASPPSPRIAVRVAVGRHERRVTAVASAAAERIPLSTGYLRAEDGDTAASPLSVVLDERRESGGMPVGSIDGESIELDGTACGARRAELPPVGPRAFVVGCDAYAAGCSPEVCVAVELRCDRMTIDADRGRATLVHRGAIPVPRAAIERISVALPGDDRSLAELSSSFARAPVALAVEELDLLAPGHDSGGEAALALAPWGLADDAGEPSMDLETYSRVSAELAELREPRSDTLARHALDETSWLREERAWLERVAAAAMDGDVTLADELGTAFVRAQDGLAAPAERETTLETYVETRVALERAEDLPAALRARSITMAAWMRLDRRISSAAATDPAFAARLEQLLAAAEARAPVDFEDEDTSPGDPVLGATSSGGPT